MQLGVRVKGLVCLCRLEVCFQKHVMHGLEVVLQAKWPLGVSLGQAGREVVAWWALLVIRQWAKSDGPIIK